MNLESMMLSERNQTQKATHCMILFICNAQNRQIYRDRKQTSGCQGLGGEEKGVTANEVSFGTMKMFQNYRGDGCIIL